MRKLPAIRVPSDSHENTQTKTSNGGLQLVPVGMKPAPHSPCRECPFRRDATPGYLGGYTPEMYMDIVRSPASIACHLSNGFQTREIETQHHCYGAAAFRANIGHVCQMDGIPTHAHESTMRVGSDNVTFLGTDAEFIAHHGPAQIPLAEPSDDDIRKELLELFARILRGEEPPVDLDP